MSISLFVVFTIKSFQKLQKSWGTSVYSTKVTTYTFSNANHMFVVANCTNGWIKIIDLKSNWQKNVYDFELFNGKNLDIQERNF